MFSEKTSSKQAIAQSSPQTRSRSIPTASFEKKQQDKFQEAKGDEQSSNILEVYVTKIQQFEAQVVELSQELIS